MKKSILLLLIITNIVFCNESIAQDNISISQSRKDNLIKLLNYRFKGGYYTFEKLFNQKINYPEVAKANCVVGISIISVKVDCEGVISDLKIKTPLGYGIDNEISSFFTSTEGKWNSCNEEKYTKFEIPIQFIIKGTETNTEDALLVCETNTPGHICNSDEYYIKKIEKYMEKKKFRKVIPYIDMMIRRDPYNSYYFDMKRKAINGGE